MKKQVLIVLLLSAALPQYQQLPIYAYSEVSSLAAGCGIEWIFQTEGGKQTVLAMPDIESLPQVKVATHESENNATFEGGALKTVLEKGELSSDTPRQAVSFMSSRGSCRRLHCRHRPS